ncbi:MAG TPA: hypothetical protein VFZ32_15860 [Micromonosporaceae bacterium]|jgi:hypothetical protein
MKGLVCLLLFPAAVAVWILGSPHAAWRVITALRRTGPAPDGPAYLVLRVGATLALFSILVLIILISRPSE